MSIIGGGGFFADLRNWRDSMQEELMVVTFEAEVISGGGKYPSYSAFAVFKLSGILRSSCTDYG